MPRPGFQRPAAVVVLFAVGVACRSAGPTPEDVAVVRPPILPPTALERADRAYSSGDLDAAAADYAEHLREEGEAAQDRAFFRRSLVLLQGPSPADLVEGRQLLERLVEERPGTEYRLAAETLLRLQDRIARLASDLRASEEGLEEMERQLEVLKRIDLERHRRPAPDGR